MTPMTSNSTVTPKMGLKQVQGWAAKGVALLMVANVAFVAFDASFMVLRPVYAQILPAIATHYIPSQSFWQIERYFTAFFALEYFIHTFFLSRQRPRISWGNAMLRRSYDLLMIVPFWRWLRLVPMLIRIHRSGLINLARPLAQVTHEPTAYLADRVSMFILVRLVNQTQDAVNQGELARLLLNPDRYIQVGDANTLDLLIDRLLALTVYQVLPQIQPNIEALLRQNLENTFKQNELYQGLKGIPGVGGLPVEVIDQMSDYLARSTYDAIISSYTDPQNRLALEQLTDDFKQALRRSLQEQTTQEELQSLVSDLLEEMKLNYIQRSVQQNPEITLTEVNHLQQESDSSSTESISS